MKAEALTAQFSSASCEWATPQWLFDALDREFGFTLDPCATPENAKCGKYFTVTNDGLKQSWAEEVVFMNPPYGTVIGVWMRKAWEASREGATVVCLVPARTDTEWWHRFAMRGEVRLLRGRLKFGDSKNSAPFPSAIVVFRPGSNFTGGNPDRSGRSALGNGEEGSGQRWTWMSADFAAGKRGTVHVTQRRD